jgi:hypothetical protein
LIREFDDLITATSKNENLDSIIEHNRLKANVSLSKAEIEFMFSKQAYDTDEYSYKGTIYIAQKLGKGPLTIEKKKEFLKMTDDLTKAQNAYDKHMEQRKNE